jgi:hypothetical protein
MATGLCRILRNINGGGWPGGWRKAGYVSWRGMALAQPKINASAESWLACGVWRPENGQPAAGVKRQYRRKRRGHTTSARNDASKAATASIFTAAASAAAAAAALAAWRQR